MITLNKLTFDILASLRPHLSDDEDIDLRQIEESVHNIRAQFIRNELNKNRSIDPDLVQDLGMVGVELIDSSKVDNETDHTSGVNVYRTTDRIPSVIGLHFSKAVLRVSRTDKVAKPIPLIDYKQVPYMGNGRFNATHDYCYLMNGRIYFVLTGTTVSIISGVNIQGIFQDPTEAAKFNFKTGKAVYTNDSDYPIPRWMVNSIKKELLSQFRIPAEAPSDRTNDASGQIKPESVQ